jgi:hypothetical protein
VPPPIGGRFRDTDVSGLGFLAVTAISTRGEHELGGGFELRWDRDRWGRRAGWGLGVRADALHGRRDDETFDALELGPTLRRYLIAGILAVAVAPLSLTVEERGGLGRRGARRVDELRFQAGASLIMRRVEVSLESPALPYGSPARWRSGPWVVRFGWLIE